MGVAKALGRPKQGTFLFVVVVWPQRIFGLALTRWVQAQGMLPRRKADAASPRWRWDASVRLRCSWAWPALSRVFMFRSRGRSLSSRHPLRTLRAIVKSE